MAFKGWAGRLGSLGFLAGDGVSLVSWATGAGVNTLQEFAPAIYTGALIFCTGAVILLNWDWANALRPSVKLAALHDEIEEWIKDADSDVDATRDVSRWALRRKLERLGINLSHDHEKRRDELLLVLLCAKERNISVARTLPLVKELPQPEQEEQQEPHDPGGSR